MNTSPTKSQLKILDLGEIDNHGRIPCPFHRYDVNELRKMGGTTENKAKTIRPA